MEKSNTKCAVKKPDDHKGLGQGWGHGENLHEFRRKGGVKSVAAEGKIKKVQKYS
ncbi:MAG TPA: hypothetical protein VLV88_15705 [Terriglobales bacterium]|nr:hypothetical protein [Terriglobales bacterium]